MNTYISQDRGDQEDYQQYIEAMDAVSIEKVASASVFFEPVQGNILVDVGMASGTSSAILARLFPGLSVIGVDINPRMVELAREHYQQPNLEFRVDDGELLSGFDRNSVNGFFNCSSIHHITSFNGYDSNRAYNTLKRQTELLKERGIIVIRDFVKPPSKEIILELSTARKPGRPDDCELLVIFSQTARSLARTEEQGFPLKEIKASVPGTRCFRLFYPDAVEFIRRKDYYANWEVELHEEYGYYTQPEFEECFRSLGLRITLSSPVYNPWIISNRYRGQFRIFDLDGKDLGIPPTNYLIAGEKLNSNGQGIRLIRHLPQLQRPFLHFSTYIHKKTKQLYDIVERPNQVIDFIPYFKHGDKVEILAKHAYPRPLASIDTDHPVIDGKHYSGYITEGITASQTMDIGSILEERAGIRADEYLSIDHSLQYYTSPGGIKEKVHAYSVKLSQSPEDSRLLHHQATGLLEQGYIRKFDAQQLLKTAQTGALVEARLELNIYWLLRKLSVPLPGWLGEKIEARECHIEKACSLEVLLNTRNHYFEPIGQPAAFLKTQRALFSETGILDSKTILEYVYPNKVSSNTLLTLPICASSGKIYVGLEVRDLPVPQLLSDNSTIITVPAKRLPKDVSTLSRLEDYIAGIDIEGAQVIRYFKLGEKYFPSIGVTTEQVYPYVVHLDHPARDLAWVSLETLLNQMEQLEDGHLLICLSRLQQALENR